MPRCAPLRRVPGRHLEGGVENSSQEVEAQEAGTTSEDESGTECAVAKGGTAVWTADGGRDATFLKWLEEDMRSKLVVIAEKLVAVQRKLDGLGPTIDQKLDRMVLHMEHNIGSTAFTPTIPTKREARKSTTSSLGSRTSHERERDRLSASQSITHSGKSGQNTPKSATQTPLTPSGSGYLHSNAARGLFASRGRSDTVSELVFHAISTEFSGMKGAILNCESNLRARQSFCIDEDTGRIPIGSDGTRRYSIDDDAFKSKASGLSNFQNMPHSTVWTILEDPDGSVLARWYSFMMPMFIGASVLTGLLQSVENSRFLHGMFAGVLDTFFDSVFTLEIVVRFAVSPVRWNFFCRPQNLVDLSAIGSLCLRVAYGFVLPPCCADDELQRYLFVCIVPIFRLLKILRRFEHFHILKRAIVTGSEAIPILLFAQALLTLMFASAIYMVEPRDNVPSLPDAIWLTIVTATTVGYYTPKSVPGFMIVSALIMSSVLLMSMPLGIIGHTFTEVWNDRDRILLMTRTRGRLAQFGFTAQDVPALFKDFCYNDEGDLDLADFRTMVSKLGIGLSEERIAQLFKVFDINNDGTIDAKEFVRILFPGEYRILYGRRVSERVVCHDVSVVSQSSLIGGHLSTVGSDSDDIPTPPSSP